MKELKCGIIKRMEDRHVAVAKPFKLCKHAYLSFIGNKLLLYLYYFDFD